MVRVQIFVPGEGTAMVIGDATLTEQMAVNWADQPYFVLQDASHMRIMTRLQAGEEGVYSYQGTCPHSGMGAPLQCTCPKMLNVLRDGRMVRYVNDEPRPVLSKTELEALIAKGKGKGKGSDEGKGSAEKGKGKGNEPFSGKGRRLGD